MNIKTIIPKELDFLLKKQKRKDAELRIVKVYNALVFKKGKTNGYFSCPSAYLVKVHPRYNKVMKLLIDHNIIEFYSKKSTDIGSVFELAERKKKFYNTETGICMKYKFLIDTTVGYEYDLEIPNNLYEGERWYNVTRNSLLELEIPNDELLIKRDNFSRRLHTNITGSIEPYLSYKTMLSGGDYYCIDSKTSQPRLLWLFLNEIGIQDQNLNWIFENDLDFYDYIIERMPIVDRDEAKNAFTNWLNGTGYLNANHTAIREIFSTANNVLRSYKTTSYKDVCALIQYREATIFVDDLLNNVPVDFCLTMHDALIVKKKDVEVVLEYCQKRQPTLQFTVEEIVAKD